MLHFGDLHSTRKKGSLQAVIDTSKGSRNEYAFAEKPNMLLSEQFMAG
jgi:hypothetical protein